MQPRRLAASLTPVFEDQLDGVGMRRWPFELEHFKDARLEFAGAVVVEQPGQSDDDGVQGMAILGGAGEQLGAGGRRRRPAGGGAMAMSPALLVDQRPDMGGVFDLGAFVITTGVTGHDLRAVDNANLRRGRQHTERAAYEGMGNGVIVKIEARVRGLADGDGDLRRPWEGVVWQRQQARSLPGEGFAHGDVASRTESVAGDAATPGVSLSIKIIEVFESGGLRRSCRGYTLCSFPRAPFRCRALR